MIFVGVIIIIGVLFFAAYAAYAVHRRSVLVDRRRTALQDQRAEILRQDQQLTEKATEALLMGKSLMDVAPALSKDRSALVREIGGESGSWTLADVDARLNEQLHAAVGRVNGRLAVTTSLVGIAILVLTIVSSASLYAFLESSPSGGASTGSFTPAASFDMAEPYDPFEDTTDSMQDQP